MVVALLHGVEAAVAVAEVAEKAWEAVERRRHDKGQAEHQLLPARLECVQAEDELALERAKNQRLRAIVDMYQAVLGESVDSDGRPQLATSELAAGDAADLFNELRLKVESPSFLAKLKLITEGSSVKTVSESAAPGAGLLQGTAQERSDWILVSGDDLVVGEPKVEQDDLGGSGFCIVTDEDIIDSIANCVARYITSVPQAKGMSPKDLQETLTKAFTDTEHKGRLRKLWNASKVCYTVASWGATIVGVYRHPVVIRAAAVAAVTSCRVIAKIVK